MEFIDLKTQYRELKDIIDARIRAVLEHGEYILGPEVEELEQSLAIRTGARHCISMASGTEALLVSLMAIGVKPGDEVITSPFSFIAAAEVVALLGAVPVFVDIEPDTCNINPQLLEECITDRTRAIIPVSLYGQPADMDEINAIARRHDLVVIEDAAQSFGATYRGRKSGNLSDLGCTSFFPSKPLGCYGDGGAVFTNDDDLARVIREIRVHGQERRYQHGRIGVGGRMDTLQCAIVLAKLENFDWEIGRRIAIGQHYNRLFDGKLPIIRQRPDRTSVFAQFTLCVDQRDELRRYLEQMGIPTAVHYPIPIPRQPAYVRFCPGRIFPVADEMAGKVISLPMSPYMGTETVEQVADALLGFFSRRLAA